MPKCVISLFYCLLPLLRRWENSEGFFALRATSPKEGSLCFAQDFKVSYRMMRSSVLHL